VSDAPVFWDAMDVFDGEGVPETDLKCAFSKTNGSLASFYNGVHRKNAAVFDLAMTFTTIILGL